jgi:hypothetical protein
MILLIALTAAVTATAFLILEEARLRGGHPSQLLPTASLPSLPFDLGFLRPTATRVEVEVDEESQLVTERHRTVAWLARQGAPPLQISAVCLEIQGREVEPTEIHGELLISGAEEALGVFLPRNFERKPL